MSTDLQAGPTMYVPRMGAFLNRWFANYDEAQVSLHAEGGFLFPYQNDFFVTTSDAVRELGIDPEDPDWQLIGWNWVKPNDTAAWERLYEKRLIAG